MHPSTCHNQNLYAIEEIHYLDRCSCPNCTDDVIPDPDGTSRHCFKHQIDPDR